MRSRENIKNLFMHGKHFCAFPWLYLHVTTLGNLSPCCFNVGGPNSKGYGSLNENSIQQLWQGEEIRKFRLKMLADEMDEQCVNCYAREKAYHNSFRTYINTIVNDGLLNVGYFKHAIKDPQKIIEWVADTDEQGYAPQAKPIYWDIRFSNLCNLKCRTCGSDSSSHWFKDKQALNEASNNPAEKAVTGIENVKAFVGELEDYYKDLEIIYFAGGEPLLFQENLGILEKLISLKKNNIPLIYSTNFTHANENSNFPKLWKEFDTVKLWISLDGSGQRGEFLRKGINWDKIVYNLEYIKKECPTADIIINYTVSAFNILHLPDFHKEMVKNNYLRADKIMLNILNDPGYYNIRILPQELKKEATERIEKHIAWIMEQDPFIYINDKALFKDFIDQWNACIYYMNSEDWTNLIPLFKRRTNALDNLRNEKMVDIFPELKPIFTDSGRD